MFWLRLAHQKTKKISRKIILHSLTHIKTIFLQNSAWKSPKNEFHSFLFISSLSLENVLGLFFFHKMENELWHVARIGNIDLMKNILHQMISGSTNQLVQSTVTYLNATDERGFSALHWAVILGRDDIINVQLILIQKLTFIFIHDEILFFRFLLNLVWIWKDKTMMDRHLYIGQLTDRISNACRRYFV